jgi:hypothetical protein
MKRMVVAAVDEVDELIEQYYRAQREFLKGNPEPVKDLFSHTEDVTLANPYGPPVRGWDDVAKTIRACRIVTQRWHVPRVADRSEVRDS